MKPDFLAFLTYDFVDSVMACQHQVDTPNYQLFSSTLISVSLTLSVCCSFLLPTPSFTIPWLPLLSETQILSTFYSLSVSYLNTILHSAMKLTPHPKTTPSAAMHLHLLFGDPWPLSLERKTLFAPYTYTCMHMKKGV